MTKLVFFGDSISDSGHFNGTIYSNGPVWSMMLPTLLATSNFYNYAVGGTESKDLVTQIDEFKKNYKSSCNNDLNMYSVAFGGNNYMHHLSSLYSQIALVSEHLSDGIHDLAKYTLENQLFIVPNLIPLALTPYGGHISRTFLHGDPVWLEENYPSFVPKKAFINKYVPDFIQNVLIYLIDSAFGMFGNHITKQHDAMISDLVVKLQSEKIPAMMLDVTALFNDITKNPSLYDFTTIDGRCNDEANPKPCDKALFLDWVHPTHYTHSIIAAYACHSLKQFGVKAPGSCSISDIYNLPALRGEIIDRHLAELVSDTAKLHTGFMLDKQFIASAIIEDCVLSSKCSGQVTTHLTDEL
jgi:hypothetical protein